MYWFRGGYPEAPTRAAVFEEASGGGDFTDYNAARNAPLKNPRGNLSRVVWHSDFFVYEVAKKTTKVINHPKIDGIVRYYGAGPDGPFSGVTAKPGPTSIYYSVRGQRDVTDVTLYTHNLGYVPIFMVAYEGSRLPTARRVQNAGAGRERYVTAFATTSIIGLRVLSYSTNQDLPAVSRTYEVICCRTPAAVAGKRAASWDGATLILGAGKVDSSKEYLRRVKAGESSFDIDLGPTTSYTNGAKRVVTGGTVIDDENYDGSFAGPSFIPVGI